MSPAAQTTPGQAARHPLASRARVLLCSVFGPYAQDDEYGSRKMNPMELYHNQVTRAQGPFSLRMFHRTWGLMLIQVNLQAPTVLLDFPTLDRFVEELVDDPEKEVRRLLDFLGLPFESACLAFYENPRAVRTASSEQVRRPISRDGLEQWKAFEPWLDPLKQALGPLLQDWHR